VQAAVLLGVLDLMFLVPELKQPELGVHQQNIFSINLSVRRN